MKRHNVKKNQKNAYNSLPYPPAQGRFPGERSTHSPSYMRGNLHDDLHVVDNNSRSLIQPQFRHLLLGALPGCPHFVTRTKDVLYCFIFACLVWTKLVVYPVLLEQSLPVHVPHPHLQHSMHHSRVHNVWEVNEGVFLFNFRRSEQG